MPNILKELKLSELSLVDKPANPEAYAPIWKSITEKGDDNMEDTIKMSDDMKAKLKPYMDKGMSAEEAMKAYEEDMQKSVDTIKAENERLRKALIDNEFVIKADSVEKKAPVEFIEVEGEQINKADIPAPILKRLEEAEADKAKADIEKSAKETLPNLKQDVAIKLIEKNLAEDEELLEFLRAVDAMFAKGMEESGETKVEADMSSAQDKLEGLAKAHATEHEMTFHKAYAEVVKTAEGKALLKAMKEDK